MKQSLKITISLLITTVLTALFSIFAFSGFFLWVEAQFYDPRLQAQYHKQTKFIAGEIDRFHSNFLKRFEPFLKNDYIASAFLKDQTLLVQDIVKRNEKIQQYKEEYRDLLFIRFIDSAGKVHFSTLDTDIQGKRANVSVYKDYIKLGETIKYEDLLVLKDEPPRMTIDGNKSRFIYSFPIVDKLGIYKGTALFYYGKEGLVNFLLTIPNFNTGDDLSLVEQYGIVINFPQDKIDVIKDIVKENWLTDTGEPVAHAGIKVLVDNVEKAFQLFSVKTVHSGYIGVLVNQDIFEIQYSFKIILLTLASLSLFLFVYLILNLKQDPLVIISHRVKQFEIRILRELVENKEDVNWNKWYKELLFKSHKIKARIKNGIRYHKKYENEIDDLINRSWEEILSVIAKRTETVVTGNIDIARIEELITKLLKNTPVVVSGNQIVPGQETGKTVAGVNVIKKVIAKDKPEKVDTDAIEEVEEAVEEIAEDEEAVEAVEAEEVLEEIAEAEEAVEAVEEAAEAEESEEVLEEIAEAEEAVEAVEEAVEAEESEEALEEIAEDEEAVEAVEEAAEAEESEEAEEAVEEIAEDEEAVEAVEEAAEAEEAVEEIAEAEEVVEAVEEAAESEEAVEEIAEAEEAVEEIAEAAEEIIEEEEEKLSEKDKHLKEFISINRRKVTELLLDDKDKQKLQDIFIKADSEIQKNKGINFDTGFFIKESTDKNKEGKREAPEEYLPVSKENPEFKDIETETVEPGTGEAIPVEQAEDEIEELARVREIIPLPPDEFEELDELEAEEDVEIFNKKDSILEELPVFEDIVPLPPDEFEALEELDLVENTEKDELTGLASLLKANISGAQIPGITVDESQLLKREKKKLEFMKAEIELKESASPAVQGKERVTDNIANVFTINSLIEEIGKIRNSIVVEDGVFKISEDLYKKDSEDLFIDSDKDDFINRFRKIKGEKKIYFSEQGLEFDDFLADNDCKGDIIKELKALILFSRRINAIAVALLVKDNNGNYNLELSIGLTETSKSLLNFEKKHKFVSDYFNKKCIVIFNRELVEIKDLKDKIAEEDHKYIKNSIFVPAIYNKGYAVLYIAFPFEKWISPKKVIEQLNIHMKLESNELFAL